MEDAAITKEVIEREADLHISFIRLVLQRKSFGDKSLAVFGLRREIEIHPSFTSKPKREEASTPSHKSRRSPLFTRIS